MGLRTFRDGAGTEWRVWDVYPARRDRRGGHDRRGEPAPDPVIERRGLADRRARPAALASTVAAPLASGWLCFDAAGGSSRRRLTPIPDGWQECAESALREHLARAAPALTNVDDRAGSGNAPSAPATR